MREICKDGRVLARHIEGDRYDAGLSFFSKDGDFIQVGAWNYGAGMELKRHIHNEVPRAVTRTQETLVLVSGSLEVTIYDLDESLVESFAARAGDVVILLDCGHGYRITSDDTRVVEIKNGPYLGAETDRRRF